MSAGSDALHSEKPEKRESNAVGVAATALNVLVQLDDFGLPMKELSPSPNEGKEVSPVSEILDANGFIQKLNRSTMRDASAEVGRKSSIDSSHAIFKSKHGNADEFKDAPHTSISEKHAGQEADTNHVPKSSSKHGDSPIRSEVVGPKSDSNDIDPERSQHGEASNDPAPAGKRHVTETQAETNTTLGHRRGQNSTNKGISEWSHQHLTAPDIEEEVQEDEWQVMPAFAPYNMYDDNNKLIALEALEINEEDAAYGGLGGAGKGYTRVQLDEDAQSATSMDENTQYLFKEVNGTSAADPENDERDALSQMQATKDLLTEGQRIAYVGMTRLTLSIMAQEAEDMENKTKGSKKEAALASEVMKLWAQKMMVRIYAHMEINTAEQIMIEQLAEHGVVPIDLTPTLMQNSRVKNPMAEEESTEAPEVPLSPNSSASAINGSLDSISSTDVPDEEAASAPPPYVEHEGVDLPQVRTPSQLPTSKTIDIDLRWTVLCDLFLTLVADSIYDARSRVLLERVGEHLNVPWTEICRFEKRVTDALEMQRAEEKENWNEDDHKEQRRKMALKKRYLMMGLATVGGGLVIGLSAGLLAPVIGAGLAAGFTTIGIAGTGGFLAGAGGVAIITSTAVASGGIIAVKAANRRTGAVKTFEYRPLHNNKRVNLIVTVSGWMTGKIDDVRLPYSTVDPIMGDIYSVLWEPEMLTSMGDTINILATEALTQGLQQVLGSTILIGLMAAVQLPVVLTKLAYLIDNPWTVSLDRANAAGLILADSLIARNLGARPITLVGYSLGARMIFSCLKELAKQGAFGIIQNVYLFGSPIVANKDEYLKARVVVAGRFVNGYARNDWILGYLFRLTSGGISRVAGLSPIDDIPRLENVNVTELVPGHMSYRTAMPRLLREVGFLVESDEFSEIEDPDPENHQKRQRELINELEEARKDFENEKKEKDAKGTFGFFSRKKKKVMDKKAWETYQESKGIEIEHGDEKDSSQGVLFDIDAIRAELAKEHLEVREIHSTLPPMKLERASQEISDTGLCEILEIKELKSTLPPMKLDLKSPTMIPTPSKLDLRQTRSHDPSATRSKGEIPTSPLPTHSLSSRRESRDRDNSVLSISNPYLHPNDDNQISFDTVYHSPARSSISLTKPRSPSPSPAWSTPPVAESTERAATLQRPELRSSNTLPVLMSMSMNPEHNAWADDDDDEFREKEVEMTFA